MLNPRKRGALQAGIRIRRPVPSLRLACICTSSFPFVLVVFNIDLTPQPIFASGWSLPSIGHFTIGQIPPANQVPFPPALLPNGVGKLEFPPSQCLLPLLFTLNINPPAARIKSQVTSRFYF